MAASYPNLAGTTTTGTVARANTCTAFGCHICGGVLVEPVTFPVCFHSVCLACAQRKFSADPSLSVCLGWECVVVLVLGLSPFSSPRNHLSLKQAKEIECGFGCGTALTSASLAVNVDLRSVIRGANLLEEHTTSSNTVNLCSLCREKSSSFKCETCGMLCAKHSKQMHEIPALKGHVVVGLGISPVVPGKQYSPKYCRIHRKEKRGLFCKQCNELICDKCFIIGAHIQHECVDLDEGRKLLVPQLSSKNVSLLQCVDELMAFRSRLEKIKGETEMEKRNQCASIKETISEMHKLLELKENQLCELVERKQNMKECRLEAQIQSVDLRLSSVKCGISCAEMSTQRLNEEDPFGFMNFGVVAIHAASLATQFASGSMVFPGASQLDELSLDCSHLSTVIRDLQLFPPVDATQSKIERAEMGPVYLSKEPIVVAAIQLCGKTGKPSGCKSALTCSCMGPGKDGMATEIFIEERVEEGPGHLVVRMSPCPTGDHTLTVKVNNNNIVGSPLIISVVEIAFPGSKILTTRELDNKLHDMVVCGEGAMGRTMANRKWRLLWRGSDHGFAAAKFHQLCDCMTPTLSIVRTTDNYVFGGYTHLQFDSKSVWKGGCGGRTFVYSLVRGGTTTGRILRCKDHLHCIYCLSSSGPCYIGGVSLYICDNCNMQPHCYSTLSEPYVEAPPHNPPNEYLAGTTNSWMVAEIEVWTPC
ncbi:hypothetical protein Pelo_3520 [Pelomyxa schiedti]|nr:hypothetical protein Pelo_3520 [Pelomyxa schiedti]